MRAEEIKDSIHAAREIRRRCEGSDNPLDQSAYRMAGELIAELENELAKLFGGEHATRQERA